ncbi:MAG: RNA polymerase sigma factor [Lacrimispora sp.]|uniref:RNA polymerase sigma factor n=1 Tax=Lacrimispora sp. TaxID=2719234 RepID=UPI0039E62BC8
MELSKVNELIDPAAGGNGAALEELLAGIQDFVFNLSLRMLGTVSDAEDATQEILIKVMTNLSTFRRESKFTTWVYRIAVNYLINYKKSMFSHRPLSFEYYGKDIEAGTVENADELLMGVSREDLALELKLSCTNVMLQCLDPQSRCIFVLGTMFKIDSRVAGEILHMTPENYRQKLCRIRRKMAEFLSSYCGLTETGICSCDRRIGYAIQHNRLNPESLEYSRLKKYDEEALISYMENMEALDESAMIFSDLPDYQSPVSAKEFISQLLKSPSMKAIQDF